MAFPSPHPPPLFACYTGLGGYTCGGGREGPAYVVQTGPHHLELIDQLLMQRAHLRVHELLMNCQPDSKDMDLFGNRRAALSAKGKPSRTVAILWCLAFPPGPGFQAGKTHLLLHELLELCDLLSICGVLGDVILIKEGLGKGRPGQDGPSQDYYFDGAPGACVRRCHLQGRWAASSQVHTPAHLPPTSCLQSQVCFFVSKKG